MRSRPRLRVDPNEHWTPVHLSRMVRKLLPFDIEVVEQPTHCDSVAALAQVRATSPIPMPFRRGECSLRAVAERLSETRASLRGKSSCRTGVSCGNLGIWIHWLT
ncbi:enolase C-terminal domain-like protein [Caballeronia sp. SEWSISQ10-4 2]|uniref:enolase C-terminal domain-like protein n=1 Tax=Caballeronia sp. SEWSISQ10-4 2 TaxID=2937438 RepID=UPI0034637DDC